MLPMFNSPYKKKTFQNKINAEIDNPSRTKNQSKCKRFRCLGPNRSHKCDGAAPFQSANPIFTKCYVDSQNSAHEVTFPMQYT